MKKRVRLGVRVRFPLNLFPNAGIFVLHLSDTDAARLASAVGNLQSVLMGLNYTKYAERFLCEVEVQAG